MTVDLGRFRDAFFDEAGEHLVTIENGLLQLEAAPNDLDLLNAIFRAAHSIKGSSGMFGLHDLTRFTHAVESLLDRLREGALPVTRARVDLLLRSADMLRELVDRAQTGAEVPSGALALAAQLVSLTDAAIDEGLSAPKAASGSARGFRITMRPHPELLLRGQDPLLLLRELQSLGRVSEVVVDVSALPALHDLDPEQCYLAWSLRLDTELSVEAIRDVFMFVDDICDVQIDDESVAGAATERSADINTPVLPEPTRPASAHTESNSIRVDTDKVDEMINLVGELVISHSMVSQLVSELGAGQPPALEEAVAEMGRNMRDLQERVLKVRMLPVSSVFNRFPRLVRDLAVATGKQIRLEMLGEETELDKSVIERIADPLTHLIRNAADHGIEMPEVRAAAGKPAEGIIQLSACHRGGSVIIDVVDDGPGLSLERIRDKAIAQGLLNPDDVVTPEQLHAFIFRPGFSTAPVITDVSGRGVGMDVVRRNIESINGSVSIESENGRGTRFRVKLPLTLAILDGMGLAVGQHVYVLPLLSIIESFRASPGAVTAMLGRGEVVQARGETVPLLRLHRALGISGAEEDPCRALIVLVEHDGRRFGLMVDELLGQSQVVIRNLEANFRRVDGVMGATIMGDGHVALILDVQGIIRLGLQGSTTDKPKFEPVLVAA
ncbi:MAG: chemotaxis protein CheA [Phycisphaerae bacterium]|nr:chemotaxis protein CheA [Gemmatimonadaceae bacterium]